MTITGVVVRRRVEDLKASVRFYEQLTGVAAKLFSFSGADLAAIGPFLLFWHQMRSQSASPTLSRPSA